MSLITSQSVSPRPAVVTFDASVSPGVYGAATPEALQAAVGAAPIPEPPPERPGVWERLRGVFGRKRADAKQRYLELLKKAEVDKRELSGKEIEALADSMERAGIGEDDAAEHRRLIGKFLAAKEGAAKLPAAQKTLAKVQESITAMEDEATAFRQRWANLETVRQQASGEYAAAAAADLNLAGLQAEVTALFGEN